MPRAVSSCLAASLLALLPTAAFGQAPPANPLIGIWKGVDVPAEFKDIATGRGVALSAWSGQLKLRADSSYEYEEYREGALGNCRVSILKKTRGRTTVTGKDLSLTPTSGTETKRDACSRDNSYSNRPITAPAERFTVALAWKETIAGWLTLDLRATSTGRDHETYVFHAVHDPLPPWPTVAIRPTRTDPIPRALPDVWVWPSGADRSFFDPATEALKPPDADVHWLHLFPDGRYEWAGWKPDVVPGPGCRRGAFAFERGRFSVNVAEWTWQQFLTLRPAYAITIDRISGCGADDGERRQPRPLLTSQYQWSFGRTVNNEEVLELKCPSETTQRIEWQYLLCHWRFDFRMLMERAR